MVILVAVIPLVMALAGSGLLVESVPAEDLSRMGVAVQTQ